MTRIRWIGWAALGLVVVSLGCSGGPRVVKVSGRATYKGEGIPSLRLNFQPDNGRPSVGDTDKEGRFTLEYDASTKGAQVGMHTVSAVYQPMSPDEEMGKVKRHPAVAKITAKFSDTMKSPLKIEITKATDNLEVKFD